MKSKLIKDTNQSMNFVAKLNSKIPKTIQTLIDESLEKQMREDTKIKEQKIIKGEINPFGTSFEDRELFYRDN